MSHYTVVMDRSTGWCSLSRPGAGFPAAEEAVWRYCADRLIECLAGLKDAWYLQTHGRQDQDSVDSPVDEDSDQAVIRGCLAHDDNSFAKLVERYEPAVTGILWHFTRDRLVLEELVQDTFVEAYFSLRRFREGAPLSPWLRTIATRVGYRNWRRRRRDRDREAILTAWRQGTLQGAAQKPSDTAEHVYRMLELLAPKDRLVLTLQYFEGCTTKEIGERTGWTLSRVKVRAFRARKKLRALLLEAEETGHERP